MYKILKSIALKITSAIVSAIMLLLFLFIAFMFFIFGQIGKNTVVNTIISPNVTYRAEVIDSDQGALGGDTIVEVYYENTNLNLYFFEIQKTPQRVYIGEWREFMDMYWESEHILIIDGNFYTIP